MEDKMSENLREAWAEKCVIIGAHTVLGRLLIQAMEDDPAVDEFFVIDLHAPENLNSKKLKFIQLDLIAPGADSLLAKELERLGAKSIIHCALKDNPSLNWVYAHELEVIGTMNLVSAAKAAKVKKFILCSSTCIYGASAKNPNYIPESQGPTREPSAHYVKDKIEAEKQVIKLFSEAPEIVCTLLRFCFVVGPRSSNYFIDLLRRPLVPSLLGYDPLMQFIHEEDALDALLLAIKNDHAGEFNIVGKGVIPLSYALRLAKRLKIPLLSAIAYPSIQLLWNMQMIAVPGRLLDYLKFLWVADGNKAKQIMNFEAKRTSKEAFLDFANSHQEERLEKAS